jgi:hypothetical protein
MIAGEREALDAMVRVVYMIPGVHRKPHEFVAKFIGRDEKDLVFSGRPLFGTIQLPENYVHEMWLTDRKPEHPHIYRGETRLR